MRLDKILDILYGNLLNNARISEFHNATFTLNNVKNASLFFVRDKSEIKEAIDKGAYGVVFEGECEISDSEIAWIKVDDINMSAYRLTRYFIMESNARFLMLSPLELSLLKDISVSAKIMQGTKLYDMLESMCEIYLKGDFNRLILTDIREVERLKVLKICSIFYTRDMQARNYEYTNNASIKVMDKKSLVKFKLLSYNLFEMKVLFESLLPQNIESKNINTKILHINLPYIFLPFLQSGISLLAYYNSKFANIESNLDSINYNISNINVSNVLQIDSKFISKHKIVIFAPNPKLFTFTHLMPSDIRFYNSLSQKISESITTDSNILIEYLRIYARHLSILACYAKGYKIKKFSPKCLCMPYPRIEYLAEILSKMPYNLALVYGISKIKFEKNNLILKSKATQTLFNI